MSPQFVDFDGDGRLDIVAGTFSGSPHLALGGEGGFAQPEQILDAEGRRIVLNQFWNYETKEWDTTRRCDAAEGGVDVPEGQGTSAIAFDWDADGDFDLLLGDYRSGRIYRRMNEGKPGAPRFAGVNLPLSSGAAVLAIPGRIETLRPVDWDGDGLVDLVCGSVESQRNVPAGVHLVRNAGKRGEPRFEAPQALVRADFALQPPPARPHGGFYPDAADVDGDGDLDLVVGAKGEWDEPARELSDAEQARLGRVKQELAELRLAIDASYTALEKELEGLDEDSEEALARTEANQAKTRPLFQRRTELTEEQDALTFGRKEGYFVWLYERVDP